MRATKRRTVDFVRPFAQWQQVTMVYNSFMHKHSSLINRQRIFSSGRSGDARRRGGELCIRSCTVIIPFRGRRRHAHFPAVNAITGTEMESVFRACVRPGMSRNAHAYYHAIHLRLGSEVTEPRSGYAKSTILQLASEPPPVAKTYRHWPNSHASC